MGSVQVTPLVVILGETASGKSSLALDIAERWNGEIISADSRTVYKGMDIGTAKATKEDRNKVLHYMLDIVNPDESFNVGAFKAQANKAIEIIAAKGKLPILVGGTGLYIDSVIFDYSFGSNGSRKDELNPRHLKMDDNFIRQTNLRENTLVIGLQVPKIELESRIEQRVENMIGIGLEEEVKELAKRYGWDAEAMTGVGYREWKAYFESGQTLEETKRLIITHSRQYAKRQRTWFKRNSYINWVSSVAGAQEKVMTFLQQNK